VVRRAWSSRGCRAPARSPTRSPRPAACAGSSATALHVQAGPDRLIDAAGRVGGATLAGLLRGAVDPAIAAWRGEAPPDLDTPGGLLPTASRPVVLGVLNVTPDSFSDGGRHGEPQAAVAAGLAMVAAGADVVDVGGESTRPGASRCRRRGARAGPAGRHRPGGEGAVVSIDTTKAAVARAAVASGAAIVNDVSAGRFDPELLPAVAELEVPYLAMHLRGEPRTMQDDPRYDDVVAEVFEFLAERLWALAQAGVPAERVAIDPGIGFGKTVAHNLTLLRRLREFTSLGRPVLVGASRKGFIGHLARGPGADRPPARLGGGRGRRGRGRRPLVRVHDVAETVQAVRVAHAIATA
jgi:dihydropteroate synthase